ncbi:MAG: flagellar basal-body MS-ring/collar protein FliF [Alphaproteobacteria bacterium]
MIGWEQLERLWAGLLSLGARRLAILALVGVSVFGAVAFGSYYLSRPSMEVLYVGLAPTDASRMGAALKEAGVHFDISTDGTKVMVAYGHTSQARMLLAEKGLPSSSNAGYELFDKLGPVGLTSFMQDITRIRALEGEIARTIQTMKDVKAARVHIVLQDTGSFRRAQQPPSASVIIRTMGAGPFSGAAAIRHLVAAAVPALTPSQVTVLDTDGSILASGGDTFDTAPQKLVELEKAIGHELQENVRKTLAPYLGIGNFEISVTSRLNTDRRQIAETSYDPDSQVARSVRNVKETTKSENAGGSSNVTVEQNIPTEQTASLGGDRSKRDSNRREDLTNYELSTKTVNTISNGYKIENLTIAVVVNRKKLLASLGKNAPPDALDKQLKEVERVASTAAGLDTKRGDKITVAAVDFVTEAEKLEPVPSISIVEELMRQAGTIFNALAVVIATFLLLWFGLRPAVRVLMTPETPEITAEETLAIESMAGAHAAGETEELPPATPEEAAMAELIEKHTSPQQRLENLIDANEIAVAVLMKQWMRTE